MHDGKKYCDEEAKSCKGPCLCARGRRPLPAQLWRKGSATAQLKFASATAQTAAGRVCCEPGCGPSPLRSGVPVSGYVRVTVPSEWFPVGASAHSAPRVHVTALHSPRLPNRLCVYSIDAPCAVLSLSLYTVCSCDCSFFRFAPSCAFSASRSFRRGCCA
jgi:hypothetical protein